MLSKHCINSVVCSLLQTLCFLPQEEGTNCLLYFLLFTFCQIIANKPFGYSTRIVNAISCIDIFQRNFPVDSFYLPCPVYYHPLPPTRLVAFSCLSNHLISIPDLRVQFCQCWFNKNFDMGFLVQKILEVSRNIGHIV